MPGSLRRSAKLHRLRGEVRAEPEIAADDMKRKVAPHHGEALRRLPDPLAERAGAAEHRADLRRRISARRDVGGAERPEQIQLAGVPLGRRSSTVSSNSRPLVRWLIASMFANLSRARAPPSASIRPPSSIRPASVKCRASNSGCVRRISGNRASMPRPPAGETAGAASASQRAMQRFLEQRVLEQIGAPRRLALDVKNLRARQLRQLGLERRLSTLTTAASIS